MAEYTTLSDLFTAIANAIRGKTGSQNQITASEFPDQIAAISKATKPYVEYATNASGSIIRAVAHFNEEIPNGMFYNRDSLTNVDLSDCEELQTIGASAFEGCSALQSVAFPEGITVIGNYAFRNCTRLTLTALPESVTGIGAHAFSGCTRLALTKLPNSFNMSYIPPGVFKLCRGLKITEIPDTKYTEIGASAFEGCYNIKISTLSDYCRTIGASAFEGCYTGVTIQNMPICLETVGSKAFYGCRGLTVVRFPSPCDIAADAFAYCQNLTDIYVPWSESDPLSANAPWGATNATVHYDVVPEPVIEREYDEDGHLTAVKLINYRSIPEMAFIGEQYLETVDMCLSPAIHTIGNGAFDGCKNAEFVSYYVREFPQTFPRHLKIIGVSAFSDCKNLSLGFMGGLPNTLEEIGSSAFEGCIHFDPTTIPASVQTVEMFAFQNTGVEQISIKANLLDALVFCNCTKLKKVWFSDNVEVILPKSADFSLFRDCPDDLEISAYADSKPDGWEDGFHYTGSGGNTPVTVTWGVKTDPINI